MCIRDSHVDYDKYEEFDKYIQEQEVWAKPLIFQDEDVKVVGWELVEDHGFKKIPDPATLADPKKADAKNTETVEESEVAEVQDEITQAVIACCLLYTSRMDRSSERDWFCTDHE